MGVPATGGAAAHAGAAGAGGGGAQPSTEYVKSMACEGGVMMEVAIAQWWTRVRLGSGLGLGLGLGFGFGLG